MCLVLGNDDFGANFCRQEWHKRILGYVVSRFSYWRGRAFVLFGVKLQSFEVFGILKCMENEVSKISV